MRSERMLMPGLKNQDVKADITAAALLADLSLLDWNNFKIMENLILEDSDLLTSDVDATLENLSEIIDETALLHNLELTAEELKLNQHEKQTDSFGSITQPSQAPLSDLVMNSFPNLEKTKSESNILKRSSAPHDFPPSNHKNSTSEVEYSEHPINGHLRKKSFSSEEFHFLKSVTSSKLDSVKMSKNSPSSLSKHINMKNDWSYFFSDKPALNRNYSVIETSTFSSSSFFPVTSSSSTSSCHTPIFDSTEVKLNPYEPPNKRIKLKQMSVDDILFSFKHSSPSSSSYEDQGLSISCKPSLPNKIPSPKPVVFSLSKQGLACSVCGDNAVCLHYGVRTCEGCKGFFKRTVQRGAKYNCSLDKKCPVDKRRRNRCQFCRFQKCLSVGMQREVVRMNTLKGRRGRLPSKSNHSFDSFLSIKRNLSSELVKLSNERDLKFIQNINLFHSNLRKTEFKFKDSSVFFHILSSFHKSLKEWTETLPDFTSLLFQDQNLLFNSSFTELLSLQFALKFSEDSYIIKLGNLNLKETHVPPVFKPWFEQVIKFKKTLDRLYLDSTSLALLESFLLFSERYNLKQQNQIEELQMEISHSLQEHISNTYNHRSRTSPVFSHILGILPQFRTLSSLFFQCLFKFKASGIDTNLLEIFQDLITP